MRNVPANSVYLGSFEVLKGQAAKHKNCTVAELPAQYVLGSAAAGGIPVLACHLPRRCLQIRHDDRKPRPEVLAVCACSRCLLVLVAVLLPDLTSTLVQDDIDPAKRKYPNLRVAAQARPLLLCEPISVNA